MMATGVDRGQRIEKRASGTDETRRTHSLVVGDRNLLCIFWCVFKIPSGMNSGHAAKTETHHHWPSADKGSSEDCTCKNDMVILTFP